MADRNSYIPPAIEKQMAAHLERNLPTNLQKHQSSGAMMPRHAESAISEHLSKNLPAHMQQYVEPYMHQKVLYGSNSPSPNRTSGTLRPTPWRPRTLTANQPINANSTDPNSNQAGNPVNPYDFILNPEKPARPPLFSGGHPKLIRSLLVGGGLIVLIVIFVVGSSILNSANNAQKQRLLEVAQTEAEIVRIAEATRNKTTNQKLTHLAALTLVSTRSSLQDTTKALAARGGKAEQKKIGGGSSPANDQLLTQAEANSNFDETYRALLKKQLDNYQIQIRAASTAASGEEKTTLVTAFEQASSLKTELDKLGPKPSQ